MRLPDRRAVACPLHRVQVGQVMAEYPLDPQLAKMVVASPEFRFASHAAAQGAAAGGARGAMRRAKHAHSGKQMCMAVTICHRRPAGLQGGLSRGCRL